MEPRTHRKIIGILRILRDAGKPLGSTRIGRELHAMGIDRSQRTVRYYLGIMDEEGLTRSLGKRGRAITPLGEMELRDAMTVEKVGFMVATVDALAYQMTFDLERLRGKVILNISLIDAADSGRAAREIMKVYSAGLGMGQFVAVAASGEQLGDLVVNGVLLKAGITTISRFGGLLEMRDGQPHRFTEIINYDGTTIDPLEIFIRGQMTQVAQAAATGNGIIGASFREIPTVGINEVERINGELERIGLGAALLIGHPNQPLLDVPMAHGRTGMIVMAGLNPLAAVEEAGIRTTNWAMKTMFDFDKLVPYEELDKLGSHS
jgi:repressor of nif and glnA expression